MESLVSLAIHAALSGKKMFCKFLSANDTGLTGAHQSGIYIPKNSISILFDEAGRRGESKDRWVNIKWQNDFCTSSRFIYYGQQTRNEYRITNFGRDFSYLKPDYTGSLFILIQMDDDEYSAYVLNYEEDIDYFLSSFGLSPTETNALVDIHNITTEYLETEAIDDFIGSLTVDFPSSEGMSLAAREIHNAVYNHAELVRTNPDKKLLDWTTTEYRLFRALEFNRYGDIISNGFESVDDFINLANQVLNRRKSRAGKSFEHHLAALFDGNHLHYQSQATTEGNKKPDFIFPSQQAYHNLSFPTEKLVTLAAKTTCKDRWRQIINEANRLRDKPKFLCTLQQGISPAQMDEMQAEQVILVVPQKYIPAYPRDRQNRIWTISQFIGYIKEIEQ